MPRFSDTGRQPAFLNEPRSPYSGAVLSESEVALRWLRRGKALAGKLFTGDGERIAVLDAGVPNRDSGPDFRDAHLLISGEVRRGDVEIHLSARSWYHHGHHTNPDYNKVVLHVVIENPDGVVTLTESGARVPTTMLPMGTDWEARLDKARGWPWEGDCGHPTADFSPGELYLLLIRLGKERMSGKVKEFKSLKLSGMSYGEIFYRGFCRGLGYSKNAAAFDRLSRLLPLKELSSRAGGMKPLELEAMLFGTANLLDSGAPDERRDALADIWRRQAGRSNPPVMKREEWRFFRLRPANFPTRRIAALSAFLCSYTPENYFHLAVYAARRFKTSEGFISVLESSLHVRGDEYWRVSSMFGKRMTHPAKLLGASRAREIVLNLVLPLLAAYSDEEGDERLASRINRLLFIYPPISDNSVLRHVRRNVLPSSPTHPMLSTSALVQQGMLHLHKRWCSTGTHWSCPLGVRKRKVACG